MLPIQKDWKAPGAAFQIPQAQAPQPKKRSLLSSLLPTLGAGAAGLIAAPFTGGLSLGATLAAIGGASALGGGLGELGAQKRGGESTNLGKIARESVVSGAFGAGGQLLSGAKALKTAKTASTALGETAPTLRSILSSGEAFTGVKNSAAAVKGAGKLAKTAESLKTNVINPRTDASVFGAADDAKIVSTVDKYVKGSNATAKYKNLEPAFNKMSGEIETKLTKMTTTTPKNEVVANLRTALADNVNFIPGDQAYEKELSRVLKKITSFSSKGELTPLEQFRAKQYIGSQLKGAFGKNGADLTIPQQVRMAVWENLDSTIAKVAPEVKELTLAQSILMKSAEGLKKSSEKTLGIPLLGVKSKTANRLMQSVGTGTAGTLGGVSKIINGTSNLSSAISTQALPRLVSGGYSSNNEMINPTSANINQPTMYADNSQIANDNIDSQYTNQQDMSSDPFAPENLQANIQQLLASGASIKDIKEYIGLAKDIQSLNPVAKEAKPLNQAQQERSDLIKALGLTEQAIEGGSINYGPIGSRVEGLKSIFNKADPETLSFKQTVSGLRAAITKARAGASLTAGELKMLEKYTPSETDSEQVVRSKLAQLRNLYGYEAPQGGGTDLASVLAAYGQ